MGQCIKGGSSAVRSHVLKGGESYDAEDWCKKRIMQEGSLTHDGEESPKDKTLEREV